MKIKSIIYSLVNGQFFNSVKDYLKWKYNLYVENKLDSEYDIDTTQSSLDYFDTVKSNNIGFAIPYEPIQHDVFIKMMGDISIPYNDYTFIDLGSGKGRALIYAANYPFRQIIGVEFSEELHLISQSNIESYIAKTGKNINFQLICMDAVDFKLPEDNLLIFLYNPFNGKVMESVIRKITAYVKSNKFNVIILYRNPQCAHMFDSNDYFQKINANTSYNIYVCKS